MKKTGANVGDSVFFACGKQTELEKITCLAREKIAKDLNLIDEDIFAFCWIVDYPMFEKNELTNKIEFSHNPFSMPQGDIDKINFEKPLEISVEEILSLFSSEERILKLRCVEGWSMIIPWNGFSLSQIISKVSLTSKAKFVEFESIYDPNQMSGQRYPVLNWPYKEGLRIDEAMHPLTTVVTGLYNKKLPNQNGAPF